jgi:hypothetical protein
MRKQLIPYFAATLTAACFLADPIGAFSAPTFIFDASGATRLNASSFAVAASSIGLTVSAFGSATGTSADVFSFPIIGGAVDAETIVFEAVNVGGIKIEGNGKVVTFNSPIVNTVASQPIMTFLETVDGNLKGRFEIFDLKVPDYPKPQTLKPGGKVHAGSIVVTLSAEGASVINATFGTSLTAGQPVGTLLVKGVLGQKIPG